MRLRTKGSAFKAFIQLKSMKERKKAMSLLRGGSSVKAVSGTLDKFRIRYSSRTGFCDSLDVALLVKYCFND